MSPFRFNCFWILHVFNEFTWAQYDYQHLNYHKHVVHIKHRGCVFHRNKACLIIPSRRETPSYSHLMYSGTKCCDHPAYRSLQWDSSSSNMAKYKALESRSFSVLLSFSNAIPLLHFKKVNAIFIQYLAKDKNIGKLNLFYHSLSLFPP